MSVQPPAARRIHRLKFRAVQLDLARQPESLDYIRGFINRIRRWDYNVLVLYLEGRIKTKSFPYRRDEESYTPDDMRRIVEYAAARNIEVVPVVALLGHAEHFVECPELESLAELRGGREGRFSARKHVFCPTVPGTMEFLEQYLSEVAPLFPSPYFHAGFDESWDIGYCDLCHKRLETETQEDIFSKHLLACHRLVSGKLKKRMIIWDDLFDIYPRALEQLPRDTVLCAWHYDAVVDRPRGHTGGPAEDIFARYRRMGFETIFAPAQFSLRNVETLTSYAAAHKPMGALMTVWELSREFLHANYPVLAYGGAAWSGRRPAASSAELQDEAVRAETGCRRPEQVALIKNLLSRRARSLPASRQAYLRGPLSEPEAACRLALEAAAGVLGGAWKTAANAAARDVLEDLAARIETERLFFDLRELLAGLYQVDQPLPPEAEWRRRLAPCLARLRALKAWRLRQWARHREGVPVSAHLQEHYEPIIDMLKATWADRRALRAVLTVRFPFAAPSTTFFLRLRGRKTWLKAASGGFGQSPFEGPFCCTFPLATDAIPEAVRVETRGYVGLGLTYLEVESPRGRYVPDAIRALVGPVSQPEAVLEDGRDWCFLGEGEQDARRKFCNPCLAQEIRAIELTLKPIR